MKENLPNIIIKDLLSKEEIDVVLSLKDQTDKKEINYDLGHRVFHTRLPDNILNKFNEYAEKIAGEPLELLAYQVARYENIVTENGESVFPLLFPHTDEVFEEPRFTLDYQIRSNTTWEIRVDNWEEVTGYTLRDNEAVTFSGTHQVHWRPKKKFNDDEFIEMIFFHYRPKNFQLITLDHVNKVRSRGKEMYEIWKQEDGINANGDKDRQYSSELRYELKVK